MKQNYLFGIRYTGFQVLTHGLSPKQSKLLMPWACAIDGICLTKIGSRGLSFIVFYIHSYCSYGSRCQSRFSSAAFDKLILNNVSDSPKVPEEPLTSVCKHIILSPRRQMCCTDAGISMPVKWVHKRGDSPLTRLKGCLRLFFPDTSSKSYYCLHLLAPDKCS